MKYIPLLILIFFSFAVYGEVSASTIVRSPNNSGLVGYWNFDVEAGGDTVYDLSGQGNNGTMTNMDPETDWVDGKIGSSALDFDGVDDRITTGTVMPIASGGSYSGWFNSADVSSTEVIMDTTDSGNRMTVQVRSNEVRGAIYNGTAIAAASGEITGRSNQWIHFTYTWDGGTVGKMYIDGVLQAGTSAPNHFGGQDDTVIGNTTNILDTDWFTGKIDDVRIYNRALSAEEITRLYDMGR